jgi:hypothetical protein
MVHGLSGYGAFWCLIERLAQESDHTQFINYNMLAYDLRCDAALIKSVVEDFGLFTFTEDGKRFYSESLMRRLQKLDDISAKRKQAAHSRWDVKDANAPENVCKCNANAQKNDANAMQVHTNSDAEERRVHERDEIENPPLPPVGGTGGADVFSERFELFWKAYPKRTGTGAAEKAFRKLKPSQELTEQMIRAVEVAKQSEQWQKENGQYIPLATTWLNQKRWKDDPMPNAKNTKTKPLTNQTEDERLLREQREEIRRMLGNENRNADE